MSFVKITDLTFNVWDSDNELLSLSSFSDLYEKYGKEKSDLIVKAHYVWLDPSWSKRKHFSENKRILEAEKVYLEKAGVKWKDVEDFTEFYREHCLTDLEREQLNMEKLVQERADYFHGLSYEKEAKTKDSMAKTHSDFVKKLKEIRDLVSEEKAGSSMRGGYKKSLLESLGNK